MTPKEKAFHLHFKFYKEIIANNEKAKQCALIAVDEIVKNGIYSFEDNRYWEEVKQEINKL
jgi:hypothetical protein